MKAKDLQGRFSYLADTIRTAAANISGNRLRSYLTVIIVTLGITCLVGSQTAIDCLSHLLSGTFGTSSERISITAAHGSGKGRTERPISYLEATLFVADCQGAQSSVYTFVPPLTPVSYSGGKLGPQTTVLAFEGNYLECNSLMVGSGRMPTPGECLVGKKVASQMTGNGGEAIGSLLNISGKAFRITGIIKEQSSLLGIITDNTVFVPLRSALGSLVSEKSGYSIDLMVPATQNSAAAAQEADRRMRQIRHLSADDKADFEIVEGSAAVREIERLSGSLKGIALIIGLLTLCGAAVALANIMLICVAERTREVGIRRAVGATRGDIRAGFVCEALLICEAGCILGTLLGIACGNILAIVLHTGVSIPWDWLLLSQGICLATGIAACVLPARRAAALNVVEALRCE